MRIETIKNSCTGCGACVHSCHQKAIFMAPDQDGFPYPKVDQDACIACGLCDKICPAINTLEMKEISAAYAAQILDKDVLKDSTSGGVFTALSREIFRRKGVVYGCVWDENNRAVITKAENEYEISAMRGSKYVWSYAGDCFFAIKKDLEAGKTVLFTGLPCQAAGLRAFLQKDYDRLYLLDCLCSGAPSPVAFQKFLDMITNKDNRNNLNLRFRDKSKYGVGVHITYTGKKRELFPRAQYVSNPYYYAFYMHLIDRECCYTCPYGTVMRVSDITMGDYWGIYKYHNEMDTRSGVSALMINTEKGGKLLSAMQKELKIIPTKTDFIGRANNLRRVGNERNRPVPPLRRKLLTEVAEHGWHAAERKYLLTGRRAKLLLKSSVPPQLTRMIRKTMGMEHSSEQTNSGSNTQANDPESAKGTIGTGLRVYGATYDHTSNYGSCLQSYALQTAVEKMVIGGEKCRYELIPLRRFPDHLPKAFLKQNIKRMMIFRVLRPLKEKKFQGFEDKYMHYANCWNRNDLAKLNETGDAFMCGSDVIWNPSFNYGHSAFYLDFARKYAFSYAASFGKSEITEENLQKIRPWIAKLNAVSVRDDQSVRYAQRLTESPVVKVVDPVLLLDRNEWSAIAEGGRKLAEGKYIFVYLTHYFPEIHQFVNELQKKTGLKLVVSTFDEISTVYMKHFTTQPPDIWLKQLINAEYVVTNSFHATVFATIFHRKFFTVVHGPKDGGINIRMNDFLKSLGLDDRLHNSVPESFDLNPADFSKVDAELARKREFSLQFLRDNLEAAYQEKMREGNQ